MGQGGGREQRVQANDVLYFKLHTPTPMFRSCKTPCNQETRRPKNRFYVKDKGHARRWILL
jgi:hypothetical protein